jgi:non-ribosomal peptide synthetase component F
MFVNAAPMRNFPVGEKTFIEFLKEVRLSTLKAYENQEFQFEDLVKKVAVNREPGRNPLFDTMFVLNNENDDYININDAGNFEGSHLPGLRIIPYKSENRAAQMDLKLRAVEIKDHLLMSFEYSTKLFKKETIELFVKNFKKIVSSIINIKEKNIELSRIEIAHDLIQLNSTILEEDGGDFDFGNSFNLA